jgi:hypothetical protein
MPAAGARTMGDLALLELGCSVWSRERRHADDVPIGGVIVGVHDVADRETGEVSRVFDVLDPYRTRPHFHFYILTEAEIDRSVLEPPESHRLRTLIRRMGEEVGKGRGLFTPQHVRLVALMHLLTGLLG